MKRGQVFVRALQADGRWGNVDVLDLDEVSFRAFIIDKLIDLKALYSFAPKNIDGDEISLKEKIHTNNGKKIEKRRGRKLSLEHLYARRQLLKELGHEKELVQIELLIERCKKQLQEEE